MATIAAPRPLPLDPGRITAGAGAIAVNALGLMLLMVPLALPPGIGREPHREAEPIWVLPEKAPEPRPVEKDVPRPIERRVEPPRPVAQVPAQPPQPSTSEAVEGDIVVPPGAGEVAPVVVETRPPQLDGPMQGASLQYLVAPPPPYPRDALREGLAGTVVLQVLVDVDGTPLEVSVRESSGHRALDLAARRQVLAKWRFRPAMRDGRPVQALGILPIEFSLD